MKKLIQYADVITPNQTEALFLLDEEQKESLSTEEAYKMAKDLRKMGAKNAIITGVNLKDQDPSLCYIFYETENECSFVSHKKYSFLFRGTGDLYASVLLSLLLHKKDIHKSVKIAGEMVYLALKKTYESGITNREHGIQSSLVFDKLIKYI